MAVIEKKDMLLAQGGLMRCCTGTLAEWVENHDSAEEGTVVECQHCSSSMILDGNTWRWNKEPDPR